jgi:glycosyltransferase involved in cell wall biosynthesis
MKKIRIIYGSPPSNTPAGGVKVIYQHSELLNSLGMESAVWHPNDDSFKCVWFNNEIKTIKLEDLNPNTDLIVLPEIWTSTHANIFKNAGFKVAIYVQNCYYTHFNLNTNNSNAIQESYAAADLVLSISQDTTKYLINFLNIPNEKILLQRYSINTSLFLPATKSKIISYMPRKMSDHSSRVINILNSLLPANSWSIEQIHNMNEQQVADALARSMIFLAFSEFEGLPVPPVEAAICGNYVIGYHGQGGTEYWNSPNFQNVEQGNIQQFLSLIMNQVKLIDQGDVDHEELNSGILSLKNYFSKENEREFMQNLMIKSNELFNVS